MHLRGKHAAKLTRLHDMLSRDEDWLILVNADPDAMASALALKRIFARRTGEVHIARINAITRPDNLAMVRYLRIPLIPWDISLCGLFHRFALVDSQPHHSPAFAGIPFSLVVDHHPLYPEHPVLPTVSVPEPVVDIQPEYGATSTLFVEYLKALRIRPSTLLATALQYGIRTDTGVFTRKTTEADLRAYQSLNKNADTALLTRITRSEYLPGWIKYFSRAFASLHECGAGRYAYLGQVENPDILVVVADFFTRVHGLRWVAVCGVYSSGTGEQATETVVVIFRGDGLSMDMGRFAAEKLGPLGSAGGHRAAARAEFPLAHVGGGNVEIFVFKQLTERPKPPPPGMPGTAEPEA